MNTTKKRHILCKKHLRGMKAEKDKIIHFWRKRHGIEFTEMGFEHISAGELSFNRMSAVKSISDTRFSSVSWRLVAAFLEAGEHFRWPVVKTLLRSNHDVRTRLRQGN